MWSWAGGVARGWLFVLDFIYFHVMPQMFVSIRLQLDPLKAVLLSGMSYDSVCRLRKKDHAVRTLVASRERTRWGLECSKGTGVQRGTGVYVLPQV
jgi:hypothetical protein